MIDETFPPSVGQTSMRTASFSMVTGCVVIFLRVSARAPRRRRRRLAASDEFRVRATVRLWLGRRRSGCGIRGGRRRRGWGIELDLLRKRLRLIELGRVGVRGIGLD